MSAQASLRTHFTWEESVEKFDKLVCGHLDAGLGRQIKAAVRSLETIQVSDLMKLLGRLKVAERSMGLKPPTPQERVK